MTGNYNTANALQLDPDDGSWHLPGRGVVIHAGMSQSVADQTLHAFYRDCIDHGNGYTWSYFHRLQFGGMPCALALGFHHAVLTEVHLSVSLPDAPLESGWPTRAAIDAEIAYVRGVFTQQLGRGFGERSESFYWGVAWSGFDPKAFVASAGIRYKPVPQSQLPGS